MHDHISNDIKRQMIEHLKKLPPTNNNGTEIALVVDSGEDAFNEYPVVRVLAQQRNRTVDIEKRYVDYEIVFMISVYLEIANNEIPDSEVINTMNDLVDSIIYHLDHDEWLDETNDSKLQLQGTNTTSITDTTPSKTGTALYTDIIYPVVIRTVL